MQINSYNKKKTHIYDCPGVCNQQLNIFNTL